MFACSQGHQLDRLDMVVEIQDNLITEFRFLKFIYSEKATKVCEIFPLLLTTVHTVKNKGKISQNFVAFSEYMNFKIVDLFFFKGLAQFRYDIYLQSSSLCLYF